jgi:hypothetical protein
MISQDPNGILYDHYKDTFSLIREAEGQRKKYFLILVALLGFLFFSISYTECTLRSLNGIELTGLFKFNINSIPFGILVSMVWSYLLMMVITYYQLCTSISKQYNYMHELEFQLSRLLKADYFCRVALTRKKEHPLSFNWVGILYAFAFPTILLITTARVLFLEWTCEDNNYNLVYDTTIGIIFFVMVLFYRFSILISKQPKLEPIENELIYR